MFWILILGCLVQFSIQECFEKIYNRQTGECLKYRSGYSYAYYNSDTCIQYENVDLYELHCYFSNGIFEFQHQIDHLYVLSSNLTDLKRIYFEQLVDLQTITMNGDNIEDIESGAFDDLQKLGTLNLANNNLIILSRLFLSKTNVKELDLSENKISDIDESALKLANDLTLILRENKIKNVTFLQANCKQLSSLDVSQNSIDKFVFPTACAKLVYLNISKNNLKEFYTNISSSTSLIELDLSFNNLTSINRDAFAFFQMLERLDLSHNPLFITNNLPIDLFQNKPVLKHLILANTGINDLKIGTFTKLTDLTELDLTSNNLKHLQKGLFHETDSLEILRLTNNLLTTFDCTAFKSLNLIDLNNNLWNCDILSDITKELAQKGVGIVHGDTYDTENLYGIHCIRNGREDIKTILKTNPSNDNFDSLTKYVENLLGKNEILHNQSMIANRNLSEAFWKDANGGYKDLIRNIQKDTMETLSKVSNTFDAIENRSENNVDRMKSTINDLNAIQKNYSDIYWKGFITGHQNIFENIRDNFGKLFQQLDEKIPSIKDTPSSLKVVAPKAASLKDANLDNNGNQHDKILLMGVYGIFFVIIVLCIAFLLFIYKSRRNYNCKSSETNPLTLASLEI